MKYDVFISYSRSDLSLVEPFVKEIEQKAGVKCWIDWDGIESGSEFEKVIINAIDSVDIMLFFLSENSLDSDFAQKEVNYAYNTKKKVVPIVLDGGSLRRWFLFKFGAIDYIDIMQERQCEKLFRDLRVWCKGTKTQMSPISQPIPQPIPQPMPRPVPQPAPSKTYKVGDYYDDGKKQGVVFEVSADGKHGKIVSIKESAKLKWSSDPDEQKRLIGSDNEHSGAYNMAKVRQIADWRIKYPAFAWCDDLGAGWYLPAKLELFKIWQNKDIIEKTLLSKNGGDLSAGYWSSTEDKNQQFYYSIHRAWCFYMSNNYAESNYKLSLGYVRAVSAC